MSNELLTPCLIIDADVLLCNLERMDQYASTHGLKLRPHTKTHKSCEIARLQLEFGATGLTVAKVGEAEIMTELVNDLLMAYPPVDIKRCEQIAQLARDRNVRVAIDSVHIADQLAQVASGAKVSIGVLVELDVGLKRTGVQTPESAASLAQHIAKSSGVRFDGLMYYPGQFSKTPTEDDPELQRVNALLDETITLLRKARLETRIVSGGSTPTAPASHLFHHTTEIRPGTYVYNDLNSVRAGVATLDDCAARICATVISNTVPGQVVIDAGSKALTSERPSPDASHGHMIEYPEAKIIALKEEHGMVDVSGCETAPKIGERVHIIPNHICPCVNLHDQVWLKEEGQLTRPVAVDTRGRVT